MRLAVSHSLLAAGIVSFLSLAADAAGPGSSYRIPASSCRLNGQQASDNKLDTLNLNGNGLKNVSAGTVTVICAIPKEDATSAGPVDTAHVDIILSTSAASCNLSYRTYDGFGTGSFAMSPVASTNGRWQYGVSGSPKLFTSNENLAVACSVPANAIIEGVRYQPYYN